MLVPSFNQDVASVILQRSDLAKVQTIAHMVPKLCALEILKMKKSLTPMNAGLTLYSMASVGFYDQEFYEAVVLQFQAAKATLTDLGYFS